MRALVHALGAELSVSMSTHYARKRREREPSARQIDDARLVAEIHRAREGYRAVYGAERTSNELRRRGVAVGRDRVARLMRAEGMRGVLRGRCPTTTIRDHSAARARDLCRDLSSDTSPSILQTSPEADKTRWFRLALDHRGSAGRGVAGEHRQWRAGRRCYRRPATRFSCS